jgi:hypothetical protein
MTAFLESIIAKLHVAPGPPAVKPHPQSRPQAVPPDGLALHLVSRSFAGGSWHEFPSENWVVLTPEEWGQLLPAGPAAVHASWTIPRPVAVKLAQWVYPQNEEKTTENRSRVDVADFKVTALTVEGNLVRAKIEGKIRLLHSFYPGTAAQDFAVSELSGYMDFDTAQHRIQRLRIVTDKAEYNNTEFSASLVSMSKETLEALLQ